MLTFTGPPCATCGKPASGFVYTDLGAASTLSPAPRPSEPRCSEHNPYLGKTLSWQRTVFDDMREGVVPIRVSVELLRQLSDWSEPVQVRSNYNGEEWDLEFRKVTA